MVHFEVVRGRKSRNDRVVKVWSNGEVFTIRELLELLKLYFESEDDCYPISRGFQGRSMLLKAIIDVYSGIPLPRVLKAYKLNKRRRV